MVAASDAAQNWAMFLFSSDGPRTIPDERVNCVTRENAAGRYCPVTLMLDDGGEESGLALKEALDKLEAELNDVNAAPE